MTRKRRVDRLTTAQEDYLETALRLESELAPAKTRITDIAIALGTKLPTVTRTVKRLCEMGMMNHKLRGSVELSRYGRTVALEIAHRHRDLVDFFRVVLDLPAAIAERDSCQIEHGLSPTTAQRIHEFMEYVSSLTPRQRELLLQFKKVVTDQNTEFSNIPNNRAAGWRG